MAIIVNMLMLYGFSNAVHPTSFFIYNRFSHILAIYVAFTIPKLLSGIFGVVNWLVQLFINKRLKQVMFVIQLGYVTGIIGFIFLINSYLVTPFRIRVVEKDLYFNTLPAGFDGFRIVHISDAHAGTFYSNKIWMHIIAGKIAGLHPDMIVFTGDWVNNFASEMENLIPVFQHFEPPYGKYCVTGNHDYGDYMQWPDLQSKHENHVQLLEFISQTGFHQITDSAVSVVRNNDTVYIAGVQNWGRPPFKQYGNLIKAMEFVPENAFTILLSHNPDHWQAEALKYRQIKLTLAGHTHGMQIGMNRDYLQFSPASVIYKNWAGLYQVDDRFLYVNVGLGCLAIRARFGMRPEITCIKLHQKPV